MSQLITKFISAVMAGLFIASCAAMPLPTTPNTPTSPAVRPTLLPTSSPLATTASTITPHAPEPTQLPTDTPTETPAPTPLAPPCPMAGNFSPLRFIDNTRLLVSTDKAYAIFNFETQQQEKVVAYPVRQVLPQPPVRNTRASLALSPDMQVMAWAPEDTDIQLLRTADQTIINTIPAQTSFVYDLHFSPTGDLVVLLTDYTQMTWDLDGKLLNTLPLGNFQIDPYLDWALSPHNQLLAALNYNTGSLALWDVARNEQIAEYKGADTTTPASVFFSSDGQRVGVSGGPSTLWSVSDGALVWREASNQMSDFALSPDGQLLVVSTLMEGQPQLLSGDGKPLRPLELAEPLSFGPLGFIFSPDSTLVMAWGDTVSLVKVLFVWRTADGALLYSCQLPPRPAATATATPAAAVLCPAPEFRPVAFLDDTHLLGEAAPGQYSSLAVETLQKVADVVEIPNTRFLALSPNRQILAVRPRENILPGQPVMVQLVRLADQQVLGTVDIHNAVGEIVFAPTGDKFFAEGGNGQLAIWSLDGKLLDTLQMLPAGQNSDVYPLELSPDGNWLSVSANYDFAVWDLVNQRWVTAAGDEEAAYAAWRAAGGGVHWRWFETPSPDGHLRVEPSWKDVVNFEVLLFSPAGQRLHTLSRAFSRGNFDDVRQMLFSPDSAKLLVTLDSSFTSMTTIDIWQVEEETLLSTCERSE